MRQIDADKLKKSMERMLCTGKEPDKERYTCDVVCCVIDEEPSVDAEPVRHGRWETKVYTTGDGLDDWSIIHLEEVCSECGKWQIGISNFCPNCGAKMDLEEEDK